MSCSTRGKKSEFNIWFNKLVLLVKEELTEPTLWNAERKALQNIWAPKHCISGLSPQFASSFLLTNLGTIYQAVRQ